MPDRYGDHPDDGPAYPMGDFTLGEKGTSAVAEAAEHYRRQAIDECGLCDTDGLRGGFLCNHVDYGAIAKRGIDAVRAALRKDRSS